MVVFRYEGYSNGTIPDHIHVSLYWKPEWNGLTETLIDCGTPKRRYSDTLELYIASRKEHT